jgi:hypothetical protein
MRGSVLILLLMQSTLLVVTVLTQDWKELVQYWYMPLYYMLSIYICSKWNILSFSEFKKELDNMALFKDILDNSEESSIILSEDKKLEYVNNRFLMKFKMTLIKCVTDRIQENL